MKRVKIIHQGFSDHCWYNRFTGQDFELITEDENNYYVKTGDKIGSVEKVDGEVIDEECFTEKVIEKYQNLVQQSPSCEQEISTHPLLQDLLIEQKQKADSYTQVFGPGLGNQNVVGSKIMDVGPHDRIGTFCEKCGMPFCICKTEFPKEKPTKQTEGKLFYELDFDFLTEMAKRMQANKSGKYERFGWKAGVPLEEVKQAGLRHYLEVMKGNYKDDGEEYGHIVATAINCMLMLHELKRQK